jgi:hypothetical protein
LYELGFIISKHGLYTIVLSNFGFNLNSLAN